MPKKEEYTIYPEQDLSILYSSFFIFSSTKAYNNPVICICTDGEFVYTGSKKPIIKKWRLSDLTLVSEFQHVHTEEIESLVYYEGFLYSASLDNTIRKWDVETGECVLNFEGGHECCCDIAIRETFVDQEGNTKGPLLYSCGGDKVIREWDIHTGKQTKLLLGHKKTVIALYLEGQYLFSGGCDSSVIQWDLNKGATKRIMNGHKNWVRCFAKSGDFLFSGSEDSTIKKWDLRTGECVGTMTNDKWEWFYGLACKDNYLISCSCDFTLRKWQISDCKQIGMWTGHKMLVGCLCLAGDMIISGAADCTIKKWDLNAKTLPPPEPKRATAKKKGTPRPKAVNVEPRRLSSRVSKQRTELSFEPESSESEEEDEPIVFTDEESENYESEPEVVQPVPSTKKKRKATSNPTAIRPKSRKLVKNAQSLELPTEDLGQGKKIASPPKPKEPEVAFERADLSSYFSVFGNGNEYVPEESPALISEKENKADAVYVPEEESPELDIKMAEPKEEEEKQEETLKRLKTPSSPDLNKKQQVLSPMRPILETKSNLSPAMPQYDNIMGQQTPSPKLHYSQSPSKKLSPKRVAEHCQQLLRLNKPMEQQQVQQLVQCVFKQEEEIKRLKQSLTQLETDNIKLNCEKQMYYKMYHFGEKKKKEQEEAEEDVNDFLVEEI